jgi:hypothetical protein
MASFQFVDALQVTLKGQTVFLIFAIRVALVFSTIILTSKLARTAQNSLLAADTLILYSQSVHAQEGTP